MQKNGVGIDNHVFILLIARMDMVSFELDFCFCLICGYSVCNKVSSRANPMHVVGVVVVERTISVNLANVVGVIGVKPYPMII